MISRRLALTGAIIYALVAGCDQMDKLENYYAHYGEAQAGGAIAYGLVPAALPKSAQRIQVLQRHEGNEVLASFLYDPKDMSAMVAKCETAPAESVRLPELTTEWWPNELKSKAFLTPDYQFFRCPADGGFLALDVKQALAYFWRL